MNLKSLENMLAAALIDAKEIQSKQNSNEISMIITYIENSQEKLLRLKNK